MAVMIRQLQGRGRGYKRVWGYRSLATEEEKWAYHQKGPDGVVGKYDRRGHEHGEADKFVELFRGLWFWPWLASTGKGGGRDGC